MRTRLGRALALTALLLGLALVGCSQPPERIHAQATFDDVADLAAGAPVMMADVKIGQVKSIRLDRSGHRAVVRFEVSRNAQVPADVIARVRRTTPLGEKFVDLLPRTDSPAAALLADGAVIKRTAVVSDLEQLVSSGTATFGALSASQLAILLDEGDKAFGGKGPQLNDILARLADVADGYETRTDEITSIIEDLDHLAGDLAPDVGPNGEALGNLKETLAILNASDEDFFALVRSLNRIAADGSRILGRYHTQITNQLRGLRDVTDAIADEQSSLAGVLENLPKHNTSVPLAERARFVNVLLDVILCGVPGGGDVPGDPVDACFPGDGS